MEYKRGNEKATFPALCVIEKHMRHCTLEKFTHYNVGPHHPLCLNQGLLHSCEAYTKLQGSQASSDSPVSASLLTIGGLRL